MTAKLDLDEVRGALTVRGVLDFYGWAAKKSGNDIESSACPLRADHSRRALVITPSNGLWKCHACDEGGDLFDFVALVEGLAIDVDFSKVIAKAAEIAGVSASELSDEDKAKRRAEWKARREAEENAERERKQKRDVDAVPRATSYWNDLATSDDRGAQYLTDRGVEEAMRFDGLVRFDLRHQGSPALALHGSDGSIRNVVERRLPELGEPKTPGLPKCPTAGTLVNSIREIALNPNRDIVLTEGVFDTITATIAWPGALVLGAHGAANLPKIARLAAPAAVKARTRLFIVPHEDRRGYSAALEAAMVSMHAGLSRKRGTLCVVSVGAKDLNDAWRSGWRPAA